MAKSTANESGTLKIYKPKYREHEDIQGVVSRVKNSKRCVMSSYSDFKVDSDLLLKISQGNEKLVAEVQSFIDEKQKEDAQFGGFIAVGVSKISKNDVLTGGRAEWIHVVFDQGHGVTLIAGRVGRPDWTHTQYLDSSLLYSMATMLKNR